jgi:signal peptide peptidase SppA
MPHEIRRVLAAFAARAWFIDPRKAVEIAAMLELRARFGPRATPYRQIKAFDDERHERPAAETHAGGIKVLRLYGTIVPRMERIEDVSQTAASLVDFGRRFDAAAADTNVKGIVIDVDSPGGTVDLVPEMAARIRNARREGRPIVAVANTIAASAAYWIASAADELVVTPSGEVGSIGVYTVHEDLSAYLKAAGVRISVISAGPRKVEGNYFEPLGEEARNAIAANVAYYYDLFTKDVAKARGVSQAVVKADPEISEQHFGGGRIYPAETAVKLGMADRVDTLEGVIARLSGTKGQRSRRAEMQRRRLELL